MEVCDWSSESSESSLSTVACLCVLFPGPFADAWFGATAAAAAAFEDTVAAYFFLVSAVIALGFGIVPDFCLFRASCGSPLVLALVDGLRLRGPEISGEAGLVAMKVRNECGGFVFGAFFFFHFFNIFFLCINGIVQHLPSVLNVSHDFHDFRDILLSQLPLYVAKLLMPQTRQLETMPQTRQTRQTHAMGAGFSGVVICQPAPAPTSTRPVNPHGLMNP